MMQGNICKFQDITLFPHTEFLLNISVKIHRYKCRPYYAPGELRVKSSAEIPQGFTCGGGHVLKAFQQEI